MQASLRKDKWYTARLLLDLLNTGGTEEHLRLQGFCRICIHTTGNTLRKPRCHRIISSLSAKRIRWSVKNHIIIWPHSSLPFVSPCSEYDRGTAIFVTRSICLRDVECRASRMNGRYAEDLHVILDVQQYSGNGRIKNIIACGLEDGLAWRSVADIFQHRNIWRFRIWASDDPTTCRITGFWSGR